MAKSTRSAQDASTPRAATIYDVLIIYGLIAATAFLLWLTIVH